MAPGKHPAIVLLVSAIALAVSVQVPGPAPRLDAWTILGPGGGGTTANPTISPADPNLVLVRSDMTGAYITHDGGQSWRMFNLRSGLTAFAFDPRNSRRVYAGGAALWRSDNAGQTWSMVFPDPGAHTVEHDNGDHGDYSLTSDDKNYVTGLSITQIVVDPADAKVVGVAFSNPITRGSTLIVSHDGGMSFQREQDFDSDRILLLAYAGGKRIVVGSRGVYRGASEAAAPIGESGDVIANAAAGDGYAGAMVIYATTREGKLLISRDAGRTWQPTTPALGQQSGRFGAVAASSQDGRIAYVGFRGLKLGDGRDQLYNGIAKTVDAGRTWQIVLRESTRPARNLLGSWIEQRAAEAGTNERAPIFFDAPYSLAVAPGNAAICYATNLFETYRTIDGGVTWWQLDSIHTPDGNWTTRGLDVTTSYGMQFDPFDPRHIFIDYTDIGAFQSWNGGRSWQTATSGIPEKWRNTTYWLAFDPEVRGLMWGAFSGTHDLPRPKMWRHDPSLSSFRGGIAISTDAGLHWTPSDRGMADTAVTFVLLDPASPVDHRTLYACAFGAGVYKSIDNGASWQLKNDGILPEDRFAWRMVRANDGALYLIVARSNEGAYGEAHGSGALYKSIDGAEHWQKMRLPQDVTGPTGLALDPRDNARMYLAAWGQQRANVDIGGGVYLSTDGGASWKPIFQASQHVYDVTIDPKSPDTLYICGFDAGAWRSTDAGLHWVRIRGYNFKWGHRIVVDPQDETKVYITTYGGSVWHGPAAGDPNAAEDILTPVPVAQ